MSLPPFTGKTDWPWVAQNERLSSRRPDGSLWPRISIVTPSFNQDKFIEETIRSVLLQGYPNLEYIIIDGASTDESVQIVKRYEPWLAYWASEKDEGQTDAIDKGFRRVTGEIMAYLNSDDVYALHFRLGGQAFCAISGRGLDYGALVISGRWARHLPAAAACGRIQSKADALGFQYAMVFGDSPASFHFLEAFAL